MPYQWVDPEIFLEHRGVVVYHTYDDDMLDDRLACHFTTCPHGNFEERYVFDVRDLPVPPAVKILRRQTVVDEDVVYKMIVCHAIEQGILAIPAEGDDLV